MTTKPAPCAIGLSVHTGWAACCVVAGDVRNPEVIARELVEILGDAQRFVFHMAAKMKPADAERSVTGARQDAARSAKTALGSLVDRMRGQGRPIVRCAIVARHGEMPPTAEVVQAHPRIHTAEGLFFRDILLEAARAHRLASHVFPPKELEGLAANAMAIRPAQLTKLIDGLRETLGPPWGKDERMASLAAWTALAT